MVLASAGDIAAKALARGKDGTCRGLDFNEAAEAASCICTDTLLEAAEIVTRKACSRRFDSCSIINAKSGRCPEDCKWCAQSVHYGTGAEIYPLLDTCSILKAARICEEKGIGRFSFVTSGKRLGDREVDALCRTAEVIRGQSRISLCVSAGLLGREALKKLFEAGISRYHCNLETSPSYFHELCTTHTQQEKIETLHLARAAGMDVCSGGIIGMGESMEQRLELACTLRSLGVKSVPVNILSPIRGTPLEHQEPISEDEILRTLALFRLLMPDAWLRFAGGKARLSEKTVVRAYRAGINSSILGNMLTTAGADIAEDVERIKEAGYEF